MVTEYLPSRTRVYAQPQSTVGERAHAFITRMGGLGSPVGVEKPNTSSLGIHGLSVQVAQAGHGQLSPLRTQPGTAIPRPARQSPTSVNATGAHTTGAAASSRSNFAPSPPSDSGRITSTA